MSLTTAGVEVVECPAPDAVDVAELPFATDIAEIFELPVLGRFVISIVEESSPTDPVIA